MMRLDLLGLECLHRHGHREPALAGAGGPDHERDHVVADGIDVALLAARLRPDGAAPRPSQHLGGQHLRRALVGIDHVDRAAHDRGVDRMALLQQQHELLEQPADDLRVFAGDRDLVAPDMDLGAGERLLDRAEQLIAMAEQAHHEVVAGDADADLCARQRGSVSIRARLAHCADGSPARRPTPTVSGVSGVSDEGRWERWAAEARVEEAAASRSREGWLRQAAGEDATLAGTLVDLAERGTRSGADHAIRTAASCRHLAGGCGLRRRAARRSPRELARARRGRGDRCRAGRHLAAHRARGASNRK